MHAVSIRMLRNEGGRVLDRVIEGEHLVVTRDGRPVAEIRPVGPGALDAETLVARWLGMPAVDARTFREQLDELLDASV